MNLAHRLAFLRRGMGVNRYHAYHTQAKDSVGKHSAGVATFLILMNDVMPRAELLAAALMHDIPEGEMGDIPSPAKKAMPEEARIALAHTEQQMLKDAELFYWLTQDEVRQMKLADCLDGLMFCIEERRRGNTELKVCGDRYLSYICELPRSVNLREQELRNILARWWKEANEQR